MKQIFTFLILPFAISAFAQQSGELDLNFGAAGFVITQDLNSGSNIFVMPDDRIVMIGGISDFNVIRLLADGTPDNSFGANGVATVDFGPENDDPRDVVVQPDGKIVILGVIDGGPSDDQSFGVARLNADGTIDTTFNETGKLVFDFTDTTTNYPYAIALQTDGKIVVAGYTGFYATNDYAVARINPDGTFDSSFGINGQQRINIQGDDRCRALVIQPDGKIVLGGSSYPVNVNTCGFAAVRLMPNGDLDPSFSDDGKALAKIGVGNDSVYDMALQPDGKILLAADSYVPNSQDVGVVRFTTDGVLDPSFSTDGKFTTTFIGTTDYVNAITVQPDGKIIVAGSFYTTPERNMGLLRLTTTGELDTTFSDDGRSNYVVPGDNGVTVHDVELQSTGQILVSGTAYGDFMLARVFSGNEQLGVSQWDSETVAFYPNPANTEVFFAEAVRSVAIFTLEGKQVINQDILSDKADVSQLAKGIYVLKILSADGNISRQKIVIE